MITAGTIGGLMTSLVREAVETGQCQPPRGGRRVSAVKALDRGLLCRFRKDPSDHGTFFPTDKGRAFIAQIDQEKDHEH